MSRKDFLKIMCSVPLSIFCIKNKEYEKHQIASVYINSSGCDQCICGAYWHPLYGCYGKKINLVGKY